MMVEFKVTGLYLHSFIELFEKKKLSCAFEQFCGIVYRFAVIARFR